MSYLSKFNQLVKTQNELEGYSTHLWHPIIENASCEVTPAIQELRQGLKAIFDLNEIRLNCFGLARSASMVLMRHGILHTVTTGDVAIDGRPWYGTSTRSIQNDFETAHIPTKSPAYAHSWITLIDGRVLDCTVLFSIAHRRGLKRPKLINGIYITGNATPYRIEHIPLNLGTDYIAKVADPDNPTNTIWAENLAAFMHEG